MHSQTEPFLRPWQIADAEAVFAAFQSIDMLGQGPPMPDLSAAEQWVADHLWDVSPTAFSFAIDVDGVAVGNVSVSNLETRHNTGWMSYWVSEQARGRGLASSAVASVCAWVFGQEHAFRLELGHRANNPASGRVALRSGFSLEGLERQKLRYGSERFDVLTYARLATDLPPAVELLRISL